MKKTMSILSLILMIMNSSCGQNKYQRDEFATSSGKLSITFLGHASLLFEIGGKCIYADPVGQYADYSGLPKADLILVTHQHHDHLDPAVIARLSKEGTAIIGNREAVGDLGEGTVMTNGQRITVKSFEIEAIPAYNTTPGRDRFHPRLMGNGYILNLGGERVYIAGDTENTPEMEALQNIGIAFLPMNQPYTMTPEQVAAAAAKFRPRILYPYHTGDTDVSRLSALMAGNRDVEVRIRPMK